MANIHHRTGQENTPPKRSWLTRARNWRTSRLMQWQSGIPSPEDLLAVPTTLQTGNAARAREIYSGLFDFAGNRIETGGTSPFDLQTPAPAWQAELHRFVWLKDLHAAANPIARSNAEFLVHDWISGPGKVLTGIPWQIDVVADRLIAWLSYAPLIVGNADQNFYSQFLQSIATQSRYLSQVSKTAPVGLPVLKARIAIAFVSLCFGGQNQAGWNKHMDQAGEAFGQELDRQFFADGGHISRNPDAGPEALSLLLPLRNLYAQRSCEPPTQLIATLDRVLPMLEFFRSANGQNARFNGGGRINPDQLTSIANAGHHAGKPLENAVHCGYQRLVAAQTRLLLDAGKTDPGAPTAQMHAGCLSFEMSSGLTPIVVNCGSPPQQQPELALAARATAAHSTVTLNDTSSCRFEEKSKRPSLAGPAIVDGITRVNVERNSNDEGTQVCAAHNGYLDKFALWHQRAIHLSSDGKIISGSDRFLSDRDAGSNNVSKEAQTIASAIRFHLHPDIEAVHNKDQISVNLTSATGENWKFTCIDARIEIEDSIYFDEPPRQCRQIVLTSVVGPASEVRWMFENLSSATASGKKSADLAEPTAPDDLLDLMAKNTDDQ